MSFTPRTWQIIQAQIKANIAANSVISGEATSTSPVSHWQLWTFIQALTSNLNEQAAAVLIAEIETIISQGAPQIASWIQLKVLEFQYSTTTPYLLSNNAGIIGYANVVESDRIISNCAVQVTPTGSINVKVTTGSPAAPLNSSQKIALFSYLTNFLMPNQTASLISVIADKLLVAGTVYYNGQLNSSISDSVIAALDTYIATFSTSQLIGGSFNGVVKNFDIQNVIRGVTGVVDWVPTQITVTPSIGSPIDLILASTEITRLYNTYSGYIENDSSNPFSSSLLFTPANN